MARADLEESQVAATESQRPDLPIGHGAGATKPADRHLWLLGLMTTFA